MDKQKINLRKNDFDYEEDYYDRLKNANRNVKNQGFTNKATMKKLEFDYEEDAYEPEKNR